MINNNHTNNTGEERYGNDTANAAEQRAMRGKGTSEVGKEIRVRREKGSEGDEFLTFLGLVTQPKENES